MDKEELINLIELKQEGGYWDFKRQWYNENKNCDLLHDIICMANNIVNKDGLIIIGVDEENGYELVDVSNDEYRRNTQQLVDFLRDKKFAGDVRPTIKVENVNLCGKIIDVIVVKNDNYTPYFLKERYQQLEANNIYTRIQDTNTPKKSSADIDKVELLWKKRFGLLATPIEKLEVYITHYEDWSNGPYGETEKFHKLHPEYTITYKDVSDVGDGYAYYLFSQYDSRPRWKDIIIKYHQTVLLDLLGVSLDGGRYFTPCPETDGIRLGNSIHWDISFKYMLMDSFIYKLNLFFYTHEYSDEARIARKAFLDVILLFEDEHEKNEFKNYVRNKWKDRNLYLEKIILPHIPQLSGCKNNAFHEEYENALILKNMLREYRSNISL